MARKTPPKNLLRKLAHLQGRLMEVEDTLDAIRSGSVDALVVRTPRGEQLFTLRGADQTYRALVEAMNEGAISVNHGIISYCNHHFATMARCPLERIFGTSIFSWMPSPEVRPLIKSLQRGRKSRGSVEALLRAADGADVPVLLSGSRFSSDGKTAISLVVTDITERKAAERARRDLSRRIVNAQELERQRVARDLHDGVNQLLSSAKYRLNNSGTQAPEAARQSIEHARLLLEKAIAEVRLIGRNLRPSELDDLGLAAALRSLTHEFHTRYNIGVCFRHRLRSKMPSEIEMALYRIAQEALTNVAKHSGATRAEVSLGCSNGEVQLMVRDNGQGLQSADAINHESGWGMKNMRERSALLGGNFFIGGSPPCGTVVRVTIPMKFHSPPEILRNEKTA